MYYMGNTYFFNEQIRVKLIFQTNILYLVRVLTTCYIVNHEQMHINALEETILKTLQKHSDVLIPGQAEPRRS